jgi:glycosyltransferase involved in cell wall biosynthesis
MSESVELVFAGQIQHSPEYAALCELTRAQGLEGAFRPVGFVATADLPLLFGAADVFAFPSLYEGFGLPPLEAMASGTPVVTSNVSSLPEVAGDAAILVDPYIPQAIADGIYQVLTDESLRRSLRQKGLARAAQFSWEQSVQRVRAIYGEVANGPKR